MQFNVVVWYSFFLDLLSVASCIQQLNPNEDKKSVVKPEIVIPGAWKVNKDETFLFLPLDIPSVLSLERVKIMSNGEQILVMVTRQAKDKPETDALKKYRLILDALKQQAGYDERLLQKHLEEWYQTEDDEEVRVHIKSALDSMENVRDAKSHESGPPPTVRIPLGMLLKQASRQNDDLDNATRSEASRQNDGLDNATRSEASIAFLAATAPHHAMVTATKGSSWIADAAYHSQEHLRIVTESFAVDIPFPVPAEQVFIMQTPDKNLMVTMPLKRESLEAKGISTGGKPFLTSPMYNLQGQLIGGPDEAADLYSIAPNLRREYFLKSEALKDLGQ